MSNVFECRGFLSDENISINCSHLTGYDFLEQHHVPTDVCHAISLHGSYFPFRELKLTSRDKFVMISTYLFLIVLVSTISAIVTAADEYFEGDGTSYTLGQISSGNCNFMSAIPSASTNYVAINQAQWNNQRGCGRCLEVSCIDERCKVHNKTAIVQVLDRCPECAHGAVDLSPTVYKEITGMDPHRLKMRWHFVNCPNPGNVKVCLKEGSGSEWIAIQPTNGVVGVESVMINGATTTMLDGAYYYVLVTKKANLSAVKVSITSITGEKIDGTYSLKVGKCTDTMKQFKTGSTTSQSPTPSTTRATPTATPTSPTATPTASPKPPTATPTSPTATPTAAPKVPKSPSFPKFAPPATFTFLTKSTTDPTQTDLSNDVGQEANSSDSQIDQTPQIDDTSGTDQNALIHPPENEISTSKTPISTITPDVVPATPEANITTSEVPSAASSNVPSQTDDASKCRVKGRHRRA
ncbi:putative rlpA-like protein, double-psi beta-barrel [Plasmopara halstedii]